MKTWMLVSGAIVALVVIYFILAFFFRLPPFSKKKEEPKNNEESGSTLLSSPVIVENMDISGSSEEESETSGYMMTSYYNIEKVNPLLQFKVDFIVPDDPNTIFIRQWVVMLVIDDEYDQDVLFEKKINYNANKKDSSGDIENFTKEKRATTDLVNLSESLQAEYNLEEELTKPNIKIKILIFYKVSNSNDLYNAINISETSVQDSDKLTQPGTTINSDMFNIDNFITNLNRLTEQEFSEFKQEIKVNISTDLDTLMIEANYAELNTAQQYNFFVKEGYGDVEVGRGFAFRPTENKKFRIFKGGRKIDTNNTEIFNYNNHPVYTGFVTFFGNKNDDENDSTVFLSVNENNFQLTSDISDPTTAFRVKDSSDSKYVLPTNDQEFDNGKFIKTAGPYTMQQQGGGQVKLTVYGLLYVKDLYQETPQNYLNSYNLSKYSDNQKTYLYEINSNGTIFYSIAKKPHKNYITRYGSYGYSDNFNYGDYHNVKIYKVTGDSSPDLTEIKSNTIESPLEGNDSHLIYIIFSDNKIVSGDVDSNGEYILEENDYKTYWQVYKEV